MEGIFITITGLTVHAYLIAAAIVLIPLPARMLFNGLRGKFELK